MRFSLLAFLIIIGFSSILTFESCFNADAASLTSPDDKIHVEVGVKDGKIFYLVNCAGKIVMDTSFLTLRLKECRLGQNARMIKTQFLSKDSVWSPEIGEEELIRNNYNELCVTFREEEKDPLYFNIIFRVYPDGLSFRYSIPSQKSIPELKVLEENTHFNIKEEAVAWVGSDTCSEDYLLFHPTLLSKIDTVPLPLLIKVTDKLFLSLHESPFSYYGKTNLTVVKGSSNLYTFLNNNDRETGTVYSGQLYTPWRVVLIAESSSDLMLSRLLINLDKRENYSQIEERWQKSFNNMRSVSSIVPLTRGLGENRDNSLSKLLARNIVEFNPFHKNPQDKDEEIRKNLVGEFISGSPHTWAKTIIPDVKIGEYLTVLRKERYGDSWYLGSITNEKPHTVNLKLDFLDPDCVYEAKIFCNLEIPEM